jgi:Uma2 family endonuclease
MNMPTLKRFTIEEYHRLTELGFFQEDDHIELIQGQLTQMAAKGRAHETCNRALNKQLICLLGDRATLQNQSPITLSDDSEPEPDFAILQNRADNYLSAHPTAAEVLLVIEVSDSSLIYDQETKLNLYARENIQSYWIFNLLDAILEMYSEPYRKSKTEFGYRVKRVALPHEIVKLPQLSDLELDLSIVFPLQQNFER